MKNAPNLKYQPKDKFTEVIIFAGTDAYSHAQHWIESEGRKHGDNVPPVYLGPKQLADLVNIRIVDDERRFARVYLAGRSNQSRSMLSLKNWRWLAYRRRNYTKASPTGNRRTGAITCNGSANRQSAGIFCQEGLRKTQNLSFQNGG